MLKDMEEKLKVIKINLKEALDRHKNLAYLKQILREFKFDDKLFLKFKVEKSAIKTSKLGARFVGPFSIL